MSLESTLDSIAFQENKLMKWMILNGLSYSEVPLMEF